VLVSATDGVGTKLMIAFRTGIHDTVGIDLVAMNVNDILTLGAEPLFFLDYFATGALDERVYNAVLAGIAHGCEIAGCSLIGGETAEMPDFYSPGEYDLAGFCVGLLDKAKSVDTSRIVPGDAVIGVASSGLHSNGFSLVRRALLDREGRKLDSPGSDPSRTLGEELLTPTRIYVKPVLRLLDSIVPRGMAHITGGGFYGNIPRILPENVRVSIRKSSWTPAPVFSLVRHAARLDEHEMFRTFNMGIGFILVVEPDHVDTTLNLLDAEGLESRVIGAVEPRAHDEAQVRIE
jgi:phosphoribosylformylglycinamidine cyclo-ligase